MFLEKYLNTTYIDLIYSNYNEDYIKSLDENNFNKIYTLLKKHKFYFIDDIILDYLEIFEYEEKYVEKAILTVKDYLGENYVNIIGKNMPILEKIKEITLILSKKDDLN